MGDSQPRSAADYPSNSGLVLFAAGTSPVRKRRRLTFLAVHLLVAAGLVWPLPALLRGPGTLLGLPAPMVWSIVLLTLEFAALLWLFRSEGRDRRDG